MPKDDQIALDRRPLDWSSAVTLRALGREERAALAARIRLGELPRFAERDDRRGVVAWYDVEGQVATVATVTKDRHRGYVVYSLHGPLSSSSRVLREQVGEAPEGLMLVLLRWLEAAPREGVASW